MGKTLADHVKGLHPIPHLIVLTLDEWRDHIDDIPLKLHCNLPEYYSDFGVPISFALPWENGPMHLTKNSKMWNWGFGDRLFLIWSHTLNYTNGNPVDDVHCTNNCFSPKFWLHFLALKHTSSHFIIALFFGTTTSSSYERVSCQETCDLWKMFGNYYRYKLHHSQCWNTWSFSQLDSPLIASNPWIFQKHHPQIDEHYISM